MSKTNFKWTLVHLTMNLYKVFVLRHVPPTMESSLNDHDMAVKDLKQGARHDVRASEPRFAYMTLKETFPHN